MSEVTFAPHGFLALYLFVLFSVSNEDIAEEIDGLRKMLDVRINRYNLRLPQYQNGISITHKTTMWGLLVAILPKK